MLTKTPVKRTNRVSVVFAVDGIDLARRVSLVGDFNDWDSARTPMKRRKDGAWAATLRLPSERRFEYKILVDGERWLSDEQADALVPDPFGGHNSLVILP